jgi:hypothetical protein
MDNMLGCPGMFAAAIVVNELSMDRSTHSHIHIRNFRKKKRQPVAGALNKGENSCGVEVINYSLCREPRIFHLVSIFLYNHPAPLGRSAAACFVNGFLPFLNIRVSVRVSASLRYDFAGTRGAVRGNAVVWDDRTSRNDDILRRNSSSYRNCLPRLQG